MGLWVTLQREARSGKFEYFKPQVPRRVKDKHTVHPVTKKHIKRLVYKPVQCETKIPLSKLSQDILGDMWYWYVDPKTGEAVIMGKVRSESGNKVPKELIRIFDEVCFINFSVKDLEVLAERYCVHTDEWTKLLASKYDKVIKFYLDYKKKMEAKEPVLVLVCISNVCNLSLFEKAPAYLASTQEVPCVVAKYARAFGPAHLLSAQASGLYK
ncbi:hypothetical protein L1987_30427 [Smallanthus sonchifolius]|uniref:Uncharacterized protein n=1 Tax=Smallanthus sonchifolius TaxID=185202 RepID=A0ACB9I2K2_9ASTR|nr:hypothetical protein L1987_30427 [Smallanthus sonchifolius]